MSYRGIPRKCSVCECCGACDYEHEAEIGEFSGDYSPIPGAILREATTDTTEGNGHDHQ